MLVIVSPHLVQPKEETIKSFKDAGFGEGDFLYSAPHEIIVMLSDWRKYAENLPMHDLVDSNTGLMLDSDIGEGDKPNINTYV